MTSFMVRDYETPTVPRAWESFARIWATHLWLTDKTVVMTCSPDRYGIPVVLRVVRANGDVAISTRRGSDADDAAQRRQAFLEAVHRGAFATIELDVAGYYVGEGSVDCPWCGGERRHEEWQHVVVRELLRVAKPPAEPPGDLSPDDADDAERNALDREVASLLAAR
jgi:hypothetical protein